MFVPASNRSPLESQTLSTGQYNLVIYVLVVAAFALAASFIQTWTTRNEIGVKYRPAVISSLAITGVATLSYLVLFLKADTGYSLQNGLYIPNAEAQLSILPRYLDWSVTVPLLTVELLAVCSIAGAKASSLRATTMGAAILMIFTGYIGAEIYDGGTSVAARVLWGLISTAFMVYLYFALILAVRDTVRSGLSDPARRALQSAATLLLSVFVVYPLVFAIPVFFDSTPKWLVTTQVLFSIADIAAKAGFGALIHKTAKLRTAEDIAAGLDTLDEAVWVAKVKYSDAIQPPVRKILDLPADGVAQFGPPGPRDGASPATVPPRTPVTTSSV